MINTTNNCRCISIITTATDTMTLSGVGTAASFGRLQHQALQPKRLNRFPTKKKYINYIIFLVQYYRAIID
jgi:hypothetical protein